jgi:hypothetical protein
MNVRCVVELTQDERDVLKAMLSGGKHAARKLSGRKSCSSLSAMGRLRGDQGQRFDHLPNQAALSKAISRRR